MLKLRSPRLLVSTRLANLPSFPNAHALPRPRQPGPNPPLTSPRPFKLPRKKQDAVWSWVLLAVILATAAGGFLAYTNKSETPDASAMASGAECSAPGFHFADVLAENEQRYRAKAVRGDKSPPAGLGQSPADAVTAKTDPTQRFDAKEFTNGAAPWLCVALFASFFLGLGMLTLFKMCAHTMVWTVVYVKVGVMASLAVAFLAMGSLVPGIVFTLLTGTCCAFPKS